MENLKMKTLSFSLINFIKTMAAVTVVFTLTACPGGGGGDGAPVTTPLSYFGSYCNTCNTSIQNPVPLAVFESTNPDGNVTLTGVEVIGDARYITPNASGKNFRNYQGPIALRGRIVVRQHTQDMWSPCVLPQGAYNVQTYEVGTMGYAGGDITIPRLMTTSGAIEIVIAQGVLTENPPRLSAAVGIRRVGNVTCSSNFIDSFN